MTDPASRDDDLTILLDVLNQLVEMVATLTVMNARFLQLTLRGVDFEQRRSPSAKPPVRFTTNEEDTITEQALKAATEASEALDRLRQSRR